ncbi:G2/M phase-specific E3 ubiquitin-protein ligase [Syngnathoides biaculeatus]|uniref:G2/M phase-specific E3 ubiquitin-protein ligase n=1 Tax=Syngnathoides biaculeatus TaxID=300417 RepID=UPI002ADDA469|nr:G2/M phase-specific E3 ubiquitin-protein ligase [Syngnathoides biaculeatus]
MKKKARRPQEVVSGSEMLLQCCLLCRNAEDDPALFGDKITRAEDKICVHYFCLLTSCGVYQRGEDGEGVLGFLVDDIKQESRRSSRLTCCACKKKGACVGCNVKSCRKTVHFPCGRKSGFVSQFAENFPSYCPDHSPLQSPCATSKADPPELCSVCLDALDGDLSYRVLKCPSCHASWFHRDCVQRQAHSAGLFFFRCTLCNNKDEYQREMLRMGIYIPERDASWELEANAYADLLEVYTHCDAHVCLCANGRAHSAKTGWFEALRCLLCGSRGTHRKCSGLEVDTVDWACPECTKSAEGNASQVASPRAAPRRTPASKRRLHAPPSPVSRKKPSSASASPEELLRALAPAARGAELQVEVVGERALAAALELVRRPDFDATRRLFVRFAERRRAAPLGETARQKFFALLMEQIEQSDVFEGPPGCKDIALHSQALRDDLYFDAGRLLAWSLTCGGPPPAFFSPPLYRRLLDLSDPSDGPPAAREIAEAESGEAGGCNRPTGRLEVRGGLAEDPAGFTLIAGTQLPLRRFREGLQTLGVLDQVQLCPSAFRHVFCAEDAGVDLRRRGDARRWPRGGTSCPTAKRAAAASSPQDR